MVFASRAMWTSRPRHLGRETGGRKNGCILMTLRRSCGSCLGCVPQWIREGRLTRPRAEDRDRTSLMCGPVAQVAWSDGQETVVIPQEKLYDEFMRDGLIVTVTAGQGDGPLWAAEQAMAAAGTSPGQPRGPALQRRR